MLWLQSQGHVALSRSTVWQDPNKTPTHQHLRLGPERRRYSRDIHIDEFGSISFRFPTLYNWWLLVPLVFSSFLNMTRCQVRLGSYLTCLWMPHIEVQSWTKGIFPWKICQSPFLDFVLSKLMFLLHQLCAQLYADHRTLSVFITYFTDKKWHLLPFSLAILYYDTLLTFGDEVKFFWQEPKFGASWLFFINRYFSFFAVRALLLYKPTELK